MCFVSIGYTVRVQAGQHPVGVHNNNRAYERWREPPISRHHKAGYKTLNMDSGDMYAAQEDHTAHSKSSQSQSRHPSPVNPEAQPGSVPLTSYYTFGLSPGSDTPGQSSVVYSRSGNKAVTFPGGRRIHHANSDSSTSTGSVQFPSPIYRAKPESKGGFSPVPAEGAPVGFGPNNRKSLIYWHSSRAGPNKAIEPDSHKIPASSSRPNLHPLQKSHLKTRPKLSGYRSAYTSSNSFTPNRTNPVSDALKPTGSILRAHSTGRSSAGKDKTQTPYLPWTPRVYSSVAPPEPRGYAHVRHLKPHSEQTHTQVSAAAGGKFLETGFPSVNQNPGKYTHGSNNNNIRGRQSSNWRHPQPDRAQIHVQGKFKPFQRLDASSDSSTTANSSASETANQAFARTTPRPSLNSTGNTSTVDPSASGGLSTQFSSAMPTQGKDAMLTPQTSNMEAKSNSSLLGPNQHTV